MKKELKENECYNAEGCEKIHHIIFRCSACGNELILPDVGVVGEDVNYCPNCGRRIVSEEESKWLGLYAKLDFALTASNIPRLSPLWEECKNRFFKAKKEGDMEEAKRIIEEVE